MDSVHRTPSGWSGYTLSLLEGADNGGTPEESFAKKHRGKLAAGVLALGALGTAGYIYRDELKRFFKFGQYANEAVDDSANVVIHKLKLALNLCDIKPVNLEEIKSLLKQAKQEAKALANINQRLQEQLAQAAQPDVFNET
jgi:hypothetical protein